MSILRYEGDPRSIPVTGKLNGMKEIISRSHFSIRDRNVILHDPENENEVINIGSHMQYIVATSKLT